MMRFMTTLCLVMACAASASAQIAPVNDAGMTFGHVHLNVSDLDLHRAFWVDHFGGEVIERGPLTAIKFPSMILVLTERAPSGGSQGTVMDHFGFKVRDIEAVLAKWREAGYEVQSEFTGAEGFPNAYLMGPDSVRIELQEDPELAVEVAGYHIHFFTADYVELMAWYVDVFGVVPLQRGTIPTTADAPGMNLSFGTSRTPREPTRGRAIDHIGFEFADLESVVRNLEARGIVFDVPLREIASIGLKIAFLTDPSGVYVELTEGLVDF
jgi:catechol 2,3-dioxygenase-like lactoylglutathione lyase family enzyme